ncbi:MAG: hypothetical protein EBV29_09890 [Gammaproteobacteria bacterium]|nr:hypothetical protein [Gammaproteobacteria bacterium]
MDALSGGQIMKRREFLVVGGTLAGGFWLGASLPEQAFAATIGRFNAYLEIDADGIIHITCPQSEMGQGIHDGLPKILAEELEARWEDVRVRMPSADDGEQRVDHHLLRPAANRRGERARHADCRRRATLGGRCERVSRIRLASHPYRKWALRELRRLGRSSRCDADPECPAPQRSQRFHPDRPFDET